MQKIDNKIIVKTVGDTKLMIVECPQKPEWYYKNRIELNRIMKDVSE